jgi:hypothetical protein
VVLILIMKIVDHAVLAAFGGANGVAVVDHSHEGYSCDGWVRCGR